ncbi:penicillin-binding protein 2 [Spirochaetia bacterium]|nr:penicillin-binding protein 2 [Spirochaetia bacterium]
MSDFPAPGDRGDDRPELRIQTLTFFFILIFIVYAGRLFTMQILSGEVYRERAENTTRRTTVIPSQRGEIYDRHNDRPLVFNVDTFAVRINPAEVPAGKLPELYARLESIMNISREQIERKIPPRNSYYYQPVEIAVNVDFRTISVLAENIDTLPGVSWQSKPLRSYPETGSISHLIGYMGLIAQDELTMLYNKGYQSGDLIGKSGIERQYDEILRGKEGSETRTVDTWERRVSLEPVLRQAPVMGKNLVLTIDRDIQLLAEKALGERVGAAVVLRPHSGEVLAMVSYPWYDPNVFNNSEEYQVISNNPNKPLINRAIQSSYPPGSTFKIVMTTGILAEAAFSPDQTIDCPGEISYGNRIWKCHVGKPGHGRLRLSQAMAQSCDIYYWVVGRDYLREDRIAAYANDYGFGELTGIDLPGEDKGFIPTPRWKELSKIRARWQAGDTMNMSIGQGYTLVTPLQMANMTAMTVNDGVIYKPHILKEIRDPISGAVEQVIAPEVLHRSEVSPEVLKAVRRDMRGVVANGTAQYPLNIKSVEIAGKTGTSEVGLSDHWHSWFTAFAPYETDKPEERIVVSVIVESVNDWEWWGTYASAIIFQGIFANQTYEQAVQTLGPQYRTAAPVRGRME